MSDYNIAISASGTGGEPIGAMERIAALEARADVQDRVIEALRSEIGGLRALIRLRVPPTEEQFARDLKVQMDAR